jgi:hypothetical protein
MLRCRVRGTIDSHDIPARQDAIEAGETPALHRPSPTPTFSRSRRAVGGCDERVRARWWAPARV